MQTSVSHIYVLCECMSIYVLIAFLFKKAITCLCLILTQRQPLVIPIVLSEQLVFFLPNPRPSYYFIYLLPVYTIRQ